MNVFVLSLCLAAVHWQHPAGIVTNDTLSEIREKVATQEWAQRTLEGREKSLAPWLSLSSEDLAKVFPRKRGNVYHNFSCPDDRTRLKFDPATPHRFHCDTCEKDFEPETDAGIYPKGDRYNGTMYDGWACLFYLTASAAAADLAVVGHVAHREDCLQRAREILDQFAETIEALPTIHKNEGDPACILTYHREGDNKVLSDLAVAYELLRSDMQEEVRARIEGGVLKRMLDDIMLQPEYTFDHNNIYQFHRTVLQTALALEREDLIDWSFGYGDYAPEKHPEHRSLQRIAAKHFKPDGAFWELCSGYHLYPLDAFCELAVLTHHLSGMDPERFPADHYDATLLASPVGKVIKAALEWFVSMAMPDRTMTIIGDSMAPRAGLDSYATTAEVGYRYFGVRAVGDYDALRAGKRTWVGLLHGATEIRREATPFTSSYLSSGWVSLRNEWNGDRVWAGLNALVPGGGHQHGDRLTFTRYAQGKLLALEKATPYNDAAMREFGTLTPSHNTVTVDLTSQPQGEALKPEQVPVVTAFAAGPELKFAEVCGDRLYAQTKVYRRSIAILEDVVIDIFRVEGGSMHDWIINHAGTAPSLSVPTQPGTFDPTAWLVRDAKVFQADGEKDWEVRWRVDEVTSRLTMFGADGTQVFGIETYPIDNAIVTPQHPACQTLCVRRKDDAPFIAIWDAWKEDPNLLSATRLDQGLVIKTRAHIYHVLLGAGEAAYPGDLSLKSDGVFSVMRDRAALAMVAGAHAEVVTPEGNAALRLSAKGNAWLRWGDGEVKRCASPCVEYDTVCGEDRRRETDVLTLDVEGGLLRPR